MQFSLVAFLAIVLTVVSAAPAKKAPAKKETCDLKTCVVKLGPTGTSTELSTSCNTNTSIVAACASAAAQEGVDPISDIACITAAAATASKLPKACAGCPAKLGISGDVDSAKKAIEGLF
ncbi:hypothetical protein B0H13DRAFT_1871514 [Mycena leptocephala]|nr:hypothetical protein B0H13DRAFT_1871514 [Mycena leptocephala]